MADLISGHGGPSIGYGIGLSGKLDNEWLSIAERGMQAAARQRALDAQAALKRQGATDKENSDLAERSKISGVHPALVGDVQDKHVSFLDSLRKHTQSGSSEYALYDPNVQKPYEELMAHQSGAVNNTKLYNDFDIKRNPEYLAKNKMELTPFGQELQTEITASEDNGGRPTERLKELTKNKYGYLNREQLDKTTQPIPLNIPAFSRSFAHDIGLDTWKITNDKGDMFEDKSGKGISEDSLIEVAKNNLLTGSPEMVQILNHYGGKDKDIDLAAKEWAKLMKGYIIRSSSNTLRSKSSGGLSETQAKNNADLPRTFTTSENKGGDDTYTTFGGGGIKGAPKTTTEFSNGSFERGSMNPISKVESGMEVALPEVVAFNKVTGKPVSNKAIDAAKKSGQFDKDNIEYKVVGAGEAKFITSSKGGGQKTSSGHVIVPINDLKTDYEQNKISLDPFFKKAEELNNQIPGKEKKEFKSSGSPVKINTKSEYDALPKGSKYIDSKGNSATKK